MDGTVASRVLVFEDQAIIAMDVENILNDAGIEVAGTMGSCAQAMRWLEANDADVALLDVHLQRGLARPQGRDPVLGARQSSSTRSAMPPIGRVLGFTKITRDLGKPRILGLAASLEQLNNGGTSSH